MDRTYYSDVRAPIVPGAGLALGAAGRKNPSVSRPALCSAPDLCPLFSGGCRCGSPFRSL